MLTRSTAVNIGPKIFDASKVARFGAFRGPAGSPRSAPTAQGPSSNGEWIARFGGDCLTSPVLPPVLYRELSLARSAWAAAVQVRSTRGLMARHGEPINHPDLGAELLFLSASRWHPNSPVADCIRSTPRRRFASVSCRLLRRRCSRRSPTAAAQVASAVTPLSPNSLRFSCAPTASRSVPPVPY